MKLNQMGSGAQHKNNSNNAASNNESNNNRKTKKVLPTKKFPELKLMINGEYRNSNHTLSSDDESLAVSQLKRFICYSNFFVVSTD
jgi:hypothetical protein